MGAVGIGAEHVGGLLSISTALVALHVLIQAALVVRVLLLPHRDAASRVAWIVVIVAFPVVGIVGYVLLGEVSIGRVWIARMREVLEVLPRVSETPGAEGLQRRVDVDERFEQLFSVGRSINGFEPMAGNRAELMEDSNGAIERMIEDIDRASDHVHLLFYIWLTDRNGLAVAEALKRAAGRGVVCRAMADDVGSRGMIRSSTWREMGEAGVRLASALPVGNPLIRSLRGRVDLRNHRKIVVIDDWITYCGSQNCADPEFRVKAKYAPWVDAMMRFEGPVARQNQHLFASDWMAGVAGDDLSELLRRPMPVVGEGFAAQAFGTGPTVRNSAMPEMFTAIMFAARHELVVTTPYFVPTDPMLQGLCSCALRGVDTTIVFPARCDSIVVAAASRSCYADMLDAGVKIHEYVGGLLHTKSMTVDGIATLIGSANMDRRSLELNYENNILLIDEATTGAMRARQAEYLASTNRVSREDIDRWPVTRRLWNNAVATLGPVL